MFTLPYFPFELSESMPWAKAKSFLWTWQRKNSLSPADKQSVCGYARPRLQCLKHPALGTSLSYSLISVALSSDCVWHVKPPLQHNQQTRVLAALDGETRKLWCNNAGYITGSCLHNSATQQRKTALKGQRSKVDPNTCEPLNLRAGLPADCLPVYK